MYSERIYIYIYTLYILFIGCDEVRVLFSLLLLDIVVASSSSSSLCSISTKANKNKNREKILIITPISEISSLRGFSQKDFAKPSVLSLLKINGEGKRD